MLKKIGISLIVVFLLGLVFLLISSYSGKTKNEILNDKQSIVTPAEKRASFAIYTNGTFRIFTSPMYHNLSEEVFIEPSSPNIAIVKRDGITWRDFFSTLPFSVDEKCLITGTKQTFCTNDSSTLQFFLNEERNQKALDQIIEPDDKLLITYEAENSSVIINQINSLRNSN